MERIVRSMAAITANVIEAAGLSVPETKVAIYLPNVGQPLSMAEMIARGTSLEACAVHRFLQRYDRKPDT